MPESTTQLTESDIDEYEKKRYAAVRSWHSGDYVNWFLTVGIPALIRDLRALRAENDALKDELEVADDALENQSQWMSESRAELAQLQSENAALREQLAEKEQDRLSEFEKKAALIRATGEETFGAALGLIQRQIGRQP